MKKLFILLTFIGVLAACNNKTAKVETETDSVVVDSIEVVDSVIVDSVTVDTVQ